MWKASLLSKYSSLEGKTESVVGFWLLSGHICIVIVCGCLPTLELQHHPYTVHFHQEHDQSFSDLAVTVSVFLPPWSRGQKHKNHQTFTKHLQDRNKIGLLVLVEEYSILIIDARAYFLPGCALIMRQNISSYLVRLMQGTWDLKSVFFGDWRGPKFVCIESVTASERRKISGSRICLFKT